MIGRDEPHILVFYKDGQPKKILQLGYATLDGNEYAQVRERAEKKGYHVEIDTTEEVDFSQVLREVSRL